MEKYRSKTIVIKYGGNAMINEELKKSVMEDILLLSSSGVKVVLVHGGGPEINNMMVRVGKEPKFINGYRYTDSETVELVEMVLAGKINKELVALIHCNKGKAVGLCGVDGGMLKVVKHQGEIDLGYVGQITEVDTTLIRLTLDQGYIPVIATVGIDHEGMVYNINADTAAAVIAGSLQAERLIYMTDIKGLLRDMDDDSTLITQLKIHEVEKLIDQGIITGGMIPKIQSCVFGVINGVKAASMIDGRLNHAILFELQSNQSIGTIVKC